MGLAEGQELVVVVVGHGEGRLGRGLPPPRSSLPALLLVDAEVVKGEQGTG
jgi:hypothetical protein